MSKILIESRTILLTKEKAGNKDGVMPYELGQTLKSNLILIVWILFLVYNFIILSHQSTIKQYVSWVEYNIHEC